MALLRLSTQSLDNSLNWEKLEADFLDGVNLNITNGNNNATITGLTEGVLDNDAVNMAQFNLALEGLKQKFQARAISPTTNVTISGPQTVDGINCVDGDLVLLGGQTTIAEDGLWIVRAGAWERADYWEVGDEVGAYLVSIKEGTQFDNTGWIVTNNKGSDIVGTDDLVFLQSYGPGAVGADNGLSMSGSDVILGGALNQNTTIDATGYNFYIQGTGGIRRFWQQDNSGKGLTLTTDYAVLFQGNKQISMHRLVDGIVVNDTNTGFRYGGDYSANNTGANYNARWIPDQEWVEDYVAGATNDEESGLNPTGQVVTLTGGTTTSSIKRVYMNGNRLEPSEFTVGDDGSNRTITSAGDMTGLFSATDSFLVEYVA